MVIDANKYTIADLPAINLSGVAIDNIFFSAPVGLCVLDEQLRFVYLNEMFADINGVPVSEHLGRTPRQVVPDLGEQAEQAMRKILTTGEPLLNFEVVGQTHADPGVIHAWEESWKPIKDESGRIVGISVVAVDITKRKAALAQAQSSKAETLELVEKLKQENRNKSDFIASLSHELRNPLAAIVGSLEVIRALCGQNDRLIRCCDILKRQTTLMTHLMNDLLDITRINSNKIVLNVQPLDLVALVGMLVDDQSHRFSKKGISLSLRAGNDRIECLADKARFSQALNNLIDNAYKFTESHGRVAISIQSDEVSNEAVISVADTGRGLSRDQLKSIFQPFFQVAQSLDRAHGGLGLGLSIVKGIIELHKGTVSAESEGEGKGTTFTIRLPISSQLDH